MSENGRRTTATLPFFPRRRMQRCEGNIRSKKINAPACRRRRCERERPAEQAPAASSASETDESETDARRRAAEARRCVAAPSAAAEGPSSNWLRSAMTASPSARPRLLRSTVPSSSWRGRSTMVPSSKPRSPWVGKRGLRRCEAEHGSPLMTTTTAMVDASLMPSGLAFRVFFS